MNDRFTDILSKLIQNEGEASMLAEVVDVDTYTCTVKSVLDPALEIKDVRLNAGTNADEGIIVTPESKSVVIISSRSKVDWYVSLYSKIKSLQVKVDNKSIFIDKDNIVMNGNAKGSYIADINKLVQKIAAIETNLNNLKTSISSWVPAPMDGGAALKALVTSWAAAQINPVTNTDSIKDETIKH